jgi:hypothetical protein
VKAAADEAENEAAATISKQYKENLRKRLQRQKKKAASDKAAAADMAIAAVY